MGRNGAGKSTLLQTAAGLIEPVAGKLEVPGGHRPADPEPRATTWSASGSATSCPGRPGAAALRVVGLEHAVDADPRDLSGGERQRLALAIALAGRMEGEELPGLVALDEPTRGMDRARKDDLVELIERARRARRRRRRRHPRRRVRRRLRRAGRPARRRRRDRRRRRRPRSSPAAGTSPPRSPASSTCPASSPPSRAPRRCAARGGTG